MFNWNMRYPDAEKVDGMILWWASLNGPTALPGTYKVSLSKNGQQIETQTFEILKDPRIKSTDADLQQQFDFTLSVQEKITSIHKTLKQIAKVREQLKHIKTLIGTEESHKLIQDKIKKLDESMTTIENELYQTKNRSSQDPLNFPIKLNNKLAHLNALISLGDYKPTQQMVAYKDEITGLIDAQLSKINQLFTTDLNELNQLMKQSEIDFIQVK